ncbi:MAG: hypothetical protein V3V66_03935 [Anaerolineales bacterium]
MAKEVMTVLGPAAPQDLGITDAHSHIWIFPQNSEIENKSVLDQVDSILKELGEFKIAGGGTQVDCQPGGAGRDGNRLFELSSKSGVKIIASTGFHLEKYYPENAGLWQMNSEQAADYFLNEIKNGLEETRDMANPVLPGLIKIAVCESLKKSPLVLLEAAAEASLKSGLLIEMHTEKGAGAEEFSAYFQKRGLDLERLVICHLDKRPDIGLHQELAQAGCLLEYDTFFRPKYNPEKNLWPLLNEMVDRGFVESLACATDLAESNLWQTFGGGPGLAGFINIIKTRLEQELQNNEAETALMGANIANRLAVHY